MANEPGNFLALRFGDDSFESRSSRAKRQAQGIENQKGSFIQGAARAVPEEDTRLGQTFFAPLDQIADRRPNVTRQQ